MFKIKDINKIKSNTQSLIKAKNQYREESNKTNHFKKQFKKDQSPRPDLLPTPMKTLLSPVLENTPGK